MTGAYGSRRDPGPGDLGLAELARLERQQDETEADETKQQIPPEEIYGPEED